MSPSPYITTLALCHCMCYFNVLVQGLARRRWSICTCWTEERKGAKGGRQGWKGNLEFGKDISAYLDVIDRQNQKKNKRDQRVYIEKTEYMPGQNLCIEEEVGERGERENTVKKTE